MYILLGTVLECFAAYNSATVMAPRL